MGDETNHMELEKRLLEVYPQAEGFVETIKRNYGLNEASILDIPYGELVAYGDQTPEEGPFWTLLRSDSGPHWFHVMSFGLQKDNPSIALRRRNGMEGGGRTYRANEINQHFLKDNFAMLSQLYEGWFVEDRKLQAELSEY